MSRLLRLVASIGLALALALNGVAMAAGPVCLPAPSFGEAVAIPVDRDRPDPAVRDEAAGIDVVIDVAVETESDVGAGLEAHEAHEAHDARAVSSADAVHTASPCAPTDDGDSPHAIGHGTCAACCVAAAPPTALEAPSYRPALFAVLPGSTVDARFAFLTGGPERPPRAVLD